MTEASNKCQSLSVRQFNYLISVLISSEGDEVIKESNAITTWQIEPCCVRSDGFSNNGRIVKDLINHFCCDLSNLSRVNVVCQEVANHPAGTRHRKPAQDEPELIWHLAAMKTNVRSRSLASHRECELVHVRAQGTDSVQRRCRRVGDEGDCWVVKSRPSWFLGL